MKENISKNYSVNNLQLGVEKELLNLFDMNDNNASTNEIIALNKL